MLQLAMDNQDEIDRLKQHDVIAMFINTEGDHNGVASEVASRMDDDDRRVVFYEISDPREIYQRMKQLHDRGILPSTMIFASHGRAGQFYIGQRPELDSITPTEHFISMKPQWFIEERIDNLREQNGENSYAYSIENANGLIRSIERFMKPSRGIDDPHEDVGRKKIISLSCGFDEEAYIPVKNSNGETINGKKCSLLRTLAKILATRLNGEHIDIYGASISTSGQTRTPQGFHYNRFTGKVRVPHAASVIHIDGPRLSWHRLNEVKLRK